MSRPRGQIRRPREKQPFISYDAPKPASKPSPSQRPSHNVDYYVLILLLID